MQSADGIFLDNLLKKITSNEVSSAADYTRLTTLFTYSTPPSIRAKALVTLSSKCDLHRHSAQSPNNDDDTVTHNILQFFLPAVEQRLADVEEQHLLEVISFVTVLFAVDWRAGSTIFVRDGFQDSIMDALELYPSSDDLPIAIASILSSACGHKICRSVLSLQCSTWMEHTFHHTADNRLKAAVSLALLKASQGATTMKGVEAGLAADTNSMSAEKLDELFAALRDIVVDSCDGVNYISDALEALAYLTMMPVFKVRIVKDVALLKKLVFFRFSLQRKTLQKEGLRTTPFGLAVIIMNICTYPPRLSEEQAQIERLKRMVQPEASKIEQNLGHVSSVVELDNDADVRMRGKRLVDFGAIDLLVAIARATDSAATKMIVGKALLGLVEDKDNRGKVLQAGGAKTLMTLIYASQQTSETMLSNSLAKANVEFADLFSIQALAKLAITASPMQVFGPNEEVSVEAIKPFVYLLLHSSSTLLQTFEAMMALTNLSSASPELADRISQSEGLLSRVEFLLLEEHHLVRRAATELICNLVSSSENVYNKFSGDDCPDSGNLNQIKSRLHILIALADVEDEPTRLAASGALAVLTGSPTACKLILFLESEHHRVLLVLKQLIDPSSEEDCVVSKSVTVTPHSGLLHRGVVCVRNLFINTLDESARSKLANEAVDQRLLSALVKVVNSARPNRATETVLRPSIEALKWLTEFGVNALAQ